MKRVIAALFILSSLRLASPLCAQENQTKVIEPWLQEINVTGGHKIQVPKDMLVDRKSEGRIVLEDHNEYLGRRIYEMQEELNKVKEGQVRLEEEITLLKQIISESQNKTTTSLYH